MLEMAVLETQIFNIFWESIIPDILRTVAPTALSQIIQKTTKITSSNSNFMA